MLLCGDFFVDIWDVLRYGSLVYSGSGEARSSRLSWAQEAAGSNPASLTKFRLRRGWTRRLSFIRVTSGGYEEGIEHTSNPVSRARIKPCQPNHCVQPGPKAPVFFVDINILSRYPDTVRLTKFYI